jgi:hypothetical protein
MPSSDTGTELEIKLPFAFSNVYILHSHFIEFPGYLGDRKNKRHADNLFFASAGLNSTLLHPALCKL